MALLDPKHYFVPDVQEIPATTPKRERPKPVQLPGGCLLYRLPTSNEKQPRRRKSVKEIAE